MSDLYVTDPEYGRRPSSILHIELVSFSATAFVTVRLATDHVLNSNAASASSIIVPTITTIFAALIHRKFARHSIKAGSLRIIPWATAITCLTGALWYISDPSKFDIGFIGFQVAAGWLVFLFYTVATMAPIGAAIGLFWHAIMLTQRSTRTLASASAVNGIICVAFGFLVNMALPRQSNIEFLVLLIIGLSMCAAGVIIWIGRSNA